MSAHDLENACFSDYCVKLQAALEAAKPELLSSEELEQLNWQLWFATLANFEKYSDLNSFHITTVLVAKDSLNKVKLKK